jgi:hypothetical protein
MQGLNLLQMKKIFFIVGYIAFIYTSYSQTTPKVDTTEIRKDDNYSNFKTLKQSYSVSQTIALDSLGGINFSNRGNGNFINASYFDLTEKADLLFKKENFTQAVEFYAQAFALNNDQGQVKHRYKAACCYAKLNKIDSAFFQLNRIAGAGKYYNYYEIESEKYLETLHHDKRWAVLIQHIKSNAEKISNDLNSTIKKED